MKASLRSIPLALALAASLVGSAQAATTIRVGNSSSGAFNFIPLNVGLKQGFFTKNGLDVQEIDLGGSSKLHQAMVAGGIDFGLGSGTDIPFLVKGAPETGVGAIALTAALFGITVLYDSPIHSLADLKGKRIGISTVGSLTQWLALQVARKEGWPPDTFTFITDGSTSAPQLAALETKEIDAQVSGAALGWNLEEQKKGRLLAPASEFVGPFLMNVIFASNAIIEKEPDAVRAFLKGWYEAVNFMATHKDATVTVEHETDNYSLSVDAKQYDAVMPSLSRDGTFPPDAVEAVSRSFVELKLLPSEPDMSKYLTPRFLPSVKP